MISDTLTERLRPGPSMACPSDSDHVLHRWDFYLMINGILHDRSFVRYTHPAKGRLRESTSGIDQSIPGPYNVIMYAIVFLTMVKRMHRRPAVGEPHCSHTMAGQGGIR